jgi:hypothetical protein
VILVAGPMTCSLLFGNRHRGSSHPLLPATPPYMRVRIRRFDKVKLSFQSRKRERVEVGIGKSNVQGRTIRKSPRAMSAARSFRCEV